MVNNTLIKKGHSRLVHRDRRESARERGLITLLDAMRELRSEINAAGESEQAISREIRSEVDSGKFISVLGECRKVGGGYMPDADYLKIAELNVFFKETGREYRISELADAHKTRKACAIKARKITM